MYDVRQFNSLNDKVDDQHVSYMAMQMQINKWMKKELAAYIKTISDQQKEREVTWRHWTDRNIPHCDKLTEM